LAPSSRLPSVVRPPVERLYLVGSRLGTQPHGKGFQCWIRSRAIACAEEG
jgi:hypothetical protein